MTDYGEVRALTFSFADGTRVTLTVDRYGDPPCLEWESERLEEGQ